MKKAVVAATVVVAASVVAIAITAGEVFVWAEPASGVKAELLARGMYEPFKVKTSPASPVDFDAKSHSHLDVVVRRHDYLADSSTGWHSHPGPVFITVTQGQLTFYEANDPTCTPHVVYAGGGYVDNGRGHIGRNESGLPAQDISVIIAPVAQPFRTDLPPRANPACGF
jgi:hypothetical protein